MSRLLGALILTLLFTTALAQREASLCVGSSEFLAVDEVGSFFDAEESCIQKGGKLAVPFDEEEHNATVELAVRLGGNNNYWLGKLLSDVDS